jgi:hypothetical protein
MLYEYLCKCGKLTEVTCKIADTTPFIICSCGKKALKNFSAQIGSSSKPIYYEANFFDLFPSQRGNNTWHIPSDKLQKNKTGTVRPIK